MYVFAQRVRAPSGKRGVNAALYRHGVIPPEVWDLPVLDRLTRLRRITDATQTTARLTLAPGGNSVESFLDVVGPEGMTNAQLSEHLERIRGMVGETRCQLSDGNLAAEFCVNLGSLDVDAAFVELSQAVVGLFGSRDPLPWMRDEPLTVEVSTDDEAWYYQLDQGSTPRVQAAGGTPTRVRMRFDVADDFRRLQGPLYPHVAQFVTNLSRDRLIEMGGVRFVHQGTIVAVWPLRPGEAP